MLKTNQTSHNTRRFLLAVPCVLALATGALADNKTVEMEFSDPGNAQDATVTITLVDTAKEVGDPNRERRIPVTIPGNSTAEDKEAAIAAELNAKGVTANRLRGMSGVRLPNINKHVEVKFDNGGTMEHDVLSANAPVNGKISYMGQFDPFNPNTNQPAVFTAGVVTDLGRAEVSITSQEINFQTDGFIICDELFHRLQGQAAQIGAFLVPLGEEIQVDFDPAAVQQIGGVIYGTDSPTDGCGGSIVAGYPELVLDYDQMIGGQDTTLTVTGANAGQRVYFTYGFNTGLTYISQLDITLDLAAPSLIGSSLADPLGEASLVVPIPPAAQGLQLHLQGVVLDGTSQVQSVRVR